MTTGLRTGSFDELRVVSAGVSTNILDLVGSGGGGVTTATVPLVITGSDIALDTSGLLEFRGGLKDWDSRLQPRSERLPMRIADVDLPRLERA